MILEVEGTRPWGPSRKRVPKCIKGPKTTYTTSAVAKNSLREVKRAHFRYILGPPGPTQEMELMGPGGEDPSRSTPVSSAMIETERRGVGRSEDEDSSCSLCLL